MQRVMAALMLLCIGAGAYLGRQGLSELRERRAGSDYYARLADRINGAAGEADSASPEAEGKSSDGAPSGEAKPGVSAIDFDGLRKSSPDVVGWIRIEDTCIDYPVVRGEDNVYYLNHLPDQTENSAGSIMLDAACDDGFGSTVSILHGHHMRSGAMFGDLDQFAREEYYRAHPVIHLFTPNGDYAVEIFAACTVDGEAFGYPTGFQNAAELAAFVDGLKARTAYETDVEIVCGDRMLLLSTCAYSFETARFVVAGRIVE